MKATKWDDPRRIAQEYAAGKAFKNGLGTRGLYEQNRVNERFYTGDQWHGVSSSTDRPLVRQNIIKRIGDYKMAVIASSPLSVSYSADGVPNTLDLQQRTIQKREMLAAGKGGGMTDDAAMPVANDEEINLIMSALSDYFRVTAERLRLDDLKETVLHNAYTSGTGILYTYWDPRLKTGLYADISRRVPITGDIRCEVLDVENVYFGDPNIDDITEQPFILIAQRKRLGDIRREMKQNGVRHGLDELQPDTTDSESFAGDDDRPEPADADKATLITKLYKEWDEEGRDYRIMGVQVCGEVTVRPAFSLGVRRYPLTKFCWDRRKNCAYGESEIPHLIPNQIAINRMLTASVWAVMMTGLPIMMVNGDVVTQKVTNDPGQILKVYGTAEDIDHAIRYVQPPSISPHFDRNIAALISQTMSQAGANDAALGNMQPNNTSAIIALREAATMPLQTIQMRFYNFIEELARVWAEFWVTHYGKRALKIEDDSGIWYLPFEGTRYRDTLISVRVDVGASTLWSEAQSVQTLDNLFSRGVIDAVQYLNRLPKGIVPDLHALIRDLQETPDDLFPSSQSETAAAEDTAVSDARDTDVWGEQLPPAYRKVWQSLPEAVRTHMAENAGIGKVE